MAANLNGKEDLLFLKFENFEMLGCFDHIFMMFHCFLFYCLLLLLFTDEQFPQNVDSARPSATPDGLYSHLI